MPAVALPRASGPHARYAAPNTTLARKYIRPVKRKNAHHGMVKKTWYALKDDQNDRPFLSTLKLPSLLSSRSRLSRETTAPKPRSRKSCSLSGLAVAFLAMV